MADFHSSFKAHFPYAAPAVVLSTLGAADLSLFVLAMAAALVLLPCAFGDEVDEIASDSRDHDG